jgi:AraC-like DNA-binding protein
MMVALHQVRAVALTGYIEVARFVGLDPYALLLHAGLNPTMLEDPEVRLPGHQVLQLLTESARRSGCEAFGMLMAECRTFESLGPISLLLEHLGSAREALEVTNHYRRHLNDVFEIQIQDGDPALVKFSILPQFASRPTVDLLVAGAQIMLAGASRQTWRPSVVHFKHSAPSDVSLYRRFFPAPLQFSSSFDGFECETAVLDAPWPWARESMVQHAEKLLQMVDIRPPDAPISDRVARMLALMLPSGRATLANVATALGTNARALQRTLEREGTTFGDLLNKDRRELAQRYLVNQSQSVTAVAELTGYSSTSAFGRWFSSEFGMAPREWRELHINGGSIQAA